MSCGQEWKDDRATAKIKEWILRKLGCDVIGVELTDDQLEDALMEAQEYWQQWVGRVRSVDLPAAKRECDASEIATDVDSVVDVFFGGHSAGVDFFAWADVRVNPFQQMIGGRQGYAGIVQYQQYRKDLLKSISADFDWMWDRSRRVLVISRSALGQRIKVVYLSRCFDYEVLSSYEWKLFREYALYKAMRTLAVIRMKFPEKPSATGTFSMDGESMWANAEALGMQIEEKMRLMQRPVHIIVG